MNLPIRLKHLGTLLLLLASFFNANAQVIKGAGVIYFDSVPNVNAALSGSELAYSIKLNKVFRWNRQGNTWVEISSDTTSLSNRIDLKRDIASIIPIAKGGTGDTTASGARSNLGLVIGTDVLAPNGSAANLTGFPTLNQSTTGTASNVTGTVAIANGGTGATTATAARSNLGLVIGTDVLAPNGSAANLTNFPTLNQNTIGTASNVTGTVAVVNGGTGATTASAARSNLGLVIGTDVLAPNGSAANLTNFPTLNQNTIGTASNVTGVVAIANGGTNAITATGAINNLLPSQNTHANKYLRTDGTNVSWQTVTAGISGSGTANKIPKWTDGSTLGNSVIEESAGGDIGIGKTPSTKLDVSGVTKSIRFVVNTYGDQELSINNYAGGTSTGINLWIGNGGQNSLDSNSNVGLGSRNMAIGFNALLSNTSGYNNTAIGGSALEKNRHGDNNIGIGYAAAQNGQGTRNVVAIGAFSLINNKASENIAIGSNCMYSNSTGSSNTSIGASVLYNNTVGIQNTAIGWAALLSINSTLSASNNVAIGYNAGRYLSNGSTGLTASNSSIFIGFTTKAKEDNSVNEIVIGTSTTGNGSNTTTIGNSSTTATYIPAGKLVLSATPPNSTDQNILVRSSAGDVSILNAAVDVNKGGTGLSSYTTGDLLYASGTTTLTKLSASTAGRVLFTNGAGTAPSWGDLGTAVTAVATPSAISGSTSVTFNASSKPVAIFRQATSSGATTTITSVTISNPVAGGTYSIHLPTPTGPANQVQVNWPTTTPAFKDLALSNLGTRYYTTATIITCYHDGTDFICK